MSGNHVRKRGPPDDFIVSRIVGRQLYRLRTFVDQQRLSSVDQHSGFDPDRSIDLEVDPQGSVVFERRGPKNALKR